MCVQNDAADARNAMSGILLKCLPVLSHFMMRLWATSWRMTESENHAEASPDAGHACKLRNV